MMMNKLSKVMIALTLTMVLVLTGCATEEAGSGKPSIVTTTTMLADLARVIGGELVEVEALMGPGIDPHLYQASAGDVSKMTNADLVVYNGLHLESKLGEVFENLEGGDKIVVEIAKGVPASELVTDGETGADDPHIWFNIPLWRDQSINLYNGIVEMDPDNEATYKANYEAYLQELSDLQDFVLSRVDEVPVGQRVLITAHDAFGYFGAAYGFEVRGLQGISTASEAGTGDVTDLANYIVENQVKAIFVESSVPRKNIEALQEAVAAQGFEVKIGGELHSDSLGSAGTEAETFLGTVRENVNTIVDALK
jgi:manganese/zinc/iron transport system substrate-binding protein